MKNLKKALCTLLTMLLLISSMPSVMASDDIKVKLGGELLKFDVQPQIINSRTMVPLRAIFEALGASVDWNADTRTVTSTKGDKTISLTIDSPTMYVNGSEVTLDSPACIVDSRTLVPVRAISEAFDLKVDWDGNTRTVKIKKTISVVSEEFRKITDVAGQMWKYTYDDSGLEIAREHDGGVKVKCEYDDNERLVKETYDIVGFDGKTTTSYTNYTYDSNGNLLLQTDEYGWTKYEYDNNRLVSWETNLGGSCKFSYDANGRVIMETFAYGGWTKYDYNDKGQLINKLTSDGYKTVYEYDNNNLKAAIESNSKGEEVYRITYEYDGNNNLIFSTASDGSWSKYIQIEK